MIHAAAILIPTLLVCAYCYRRIARQEQESGQALPGAGSYYPVIDSELCDGCGTCVEACPEGDVLEAIRPSREG